MKETIHISPMNTMLMCIYALLVIIFSPAFLDKVKDKDFKQFGKDMCKIWSHLGRKVRYYYLSASYERSLKLTLTCV